MKTKNINTEAETNSYVITGKNSSNILLSHAGFTLFLSLLLYILKQRGHGQTDRQLLALLLTIIHSRPLRLSFTLTILKVKGCAYCGNPMPLHSYRASPAILDPTQVNVPLPHLNPSQVGWNLINLSQRQSRPW